MRPDKEGWWRDSAGCVERVTRSSEGRLGIQLSWADFVYMDEAGPAWDDYEFLEDYSEPSEVPEDTLKDLMHQVAHFAGEKEQDAPLGPATVRAIAYQVDYLGEMSHQLNSWRSSNQGPDWPAVHAAGKERLEALQPEHHERVARLLLVATDLAESVDIVLGLSTDKLEEHLAQALVRLLDVANKEGVDLPNAVRTALSAGGRK